MKSTKAALQYKWDLASAKQRYKKALECAESALKEEGGGSFGVTPVPEPSPPPGFDMFMNSLTDMNTLQGCHEGMNIIHHLCKHVQRQDDPKVAQWLRYALTTMKGDADTALSQWSKCKFDEKGQAIGLDGYQALHILASQNPKGERQQSVRTECMQILIEFRADVNGEMKQRITPIMKAAGTGALENVKFLCESKGDPHRDDTGGHNAINYAVLSNGKIVDYLTDTHAVIPGIPIPPGEKR